jgi:hypothetical protein
MAFSFSNPTNKRPQTRPKSSKLRKRNVRQLNFARPHKGAVRGRKPTIGQQYTQQ